jgi:hemoglobin-like flavoprotein
MWAVPMADAEAILDVLSRAVERCRDPAPLVYARLFARFPEMEALFVRDRDGAVRGEMLAKVFETIIDLIENRAYAENMVRCEVVTHAGYGVPPDAFAVFFDVVIDTLKELMGADWTTRHDQAWTNLSVELTTLSR